MTGRRLEKKQQTRWDLATASVSLLLSDGEEAATVAAIAERAGVSTRTFHNYFAAREDAYLFFLEETIRDWAEQVEAAPAGDSAFTVLRGIIAGVYARPADDVSAPPIW